MNWNSLRTLIGSRFVTQIYTRSRIERLMGRAYATALPLTGIETLVNAFGQQKQLNQFWFWVFVSALVVSQLVLVYSQWFMTNAVDALRAYAVFELVLLIGWPLQFDSAKGLAPGTEPWIWWTAGIGLIGVTLAFGIYAGTVTAIGVPIGWFFFRQTDLGGLASPAFALQEALFTLMLVVCISVLVTLMRYKASQVDEATLRAAEAAAERARTDAIESERQRIAALVHDRVLTTLLLAAKAKTKEEKEAAAKLAETAIAELTSEASEAELVNGPITVSSLFEALRTAAVLQVDNMVIDIKGASDREISHAVAEAALQATLQAVTNSVQHAGGDQVKRELILRETNKGFKIVVKDHGRGFRLSRVSRDRLGVRLSIIGRMQKVGGKVAIDSAPGSGTSVIIEWPKASEVVEP